jgi:hypothetical protein
MKVESESFLYTRYYLCKWHFNGCSWS